MKFDQVNDILNQETISYDDKMKIKYFLEQQNRQLENSHNMLNRLFMKMGFKNSLKEYCEEQNYDLHCLNGELQRHIRIIERENKIIYSSLKQYADIKEAFKPVGQHSMSGEFIMVYGSGARWAIDEAKKIAINEVLDEEREIKGEED